MEYDEFNGTFILENHEAETVSKIIQQLTLEETSRRFHIRNLTVLVEMVKKFKEVFK